MRKVTDHIVENDAAKQLEVNVLDEPGQGGANHEYSISYHAADGARHSQDISFQNGPIKEFGVNGITQEALLAVVIDRLRSFQAGQFACRDNAVALTHCEEALMWLQRRTRERIKRGVEGTNQK
jgi:hypothetical protein